MYVATLQEDELLAEIEALKDALAAGSGVTAQDLDHLMATVKGIFVAARFSRARAQ